MADVKISGLPASTVPLAGTEVLPIVQGGQTRQVSVNNLTTGKAVSAASLIVDAGAVGTPAITTTGDTNTGIFFPAADTIAFTEGGVESMRITSAGEVGIGTASPNAPLHVTRSSSGVTATFANTATNNQNANVNAVSDNATAVSLRVFGSTAGSAGMLAPNSTMLYTSAADLNLVADNVSGVMKFATGGNTERMRINSSGQVGIGTSSPANRLDAQVSTNVRIARFKNTSSTVQDYSLFLANNSDVILGMGVFGSTAGTVGMLSAGSPFIDTSATELNILASNVSGVIKFATGGATERMRVHASGGVSIGNTTDPGATNLSVTGNVVMATSGKGIDFSATAGTGTSELLADYEEGTWTPTTSASVTPPTTPKTGTGFYTKIGRQVTVTCNFLDSVNMTGSTGALTITGLPFTSASGTGMTGIGSCILFKIDTPAGTVNISPYIGASSTSFVFFATIDNLAYEAVVDNATTDGRIWFTLTYFV